MDLRETAVLQTTGTLGHEVTADTLDFAGVDRSLGRSSQDSEDPDTYEPHIVDDDSTPGHGDTYAAV